MRFGFVHRVMTDALAALGLLSLLTGGELDVTMSIIIGVSMAIAVLLPERYQDAAWLRNGGVVASLTLLGTQLTRAAGGGDLLELAVEFAAGLQVIRVATRRGAAHDQQIILLALLHLVAGTVLGGGLAYGISLVGFLVVAPGALVLSHLRREVEGNYRQGARDRTGLPVDVPRILRSRRVISRRFLFVTCSLAVPVFLFTALLFVLFPRVGLSLLLLNHSRSTRMIGFSTRVDLGGVGKLRSDPTIAMRVHLGRMPATPAPRLALYLRGTSFDQYDGTSWSRTRPAHEAAGMTGSYVWITGRPLGAEEMTIDLEPINPPIIFLPPDAVGFRLMAHSDTLQLRRPTITMAADGEYKYESVEERGLQYIVYRGRSQPEPLTPGDRERYLELPPAIERPVAELAHKWAAGLTQDWQIAAAVEQRLRSEYRYDLNSPSGAAPQPLLHFLFESKSGHCEFYSTAMAMLLRTMGIPTRNVTGFIGGSYNRFGGFYAVRQGDAHSWVEVYLDGRGWTRFDPTPPLSAEPKSEVTGMIAFLRDMMEAAAQRWSRHVVGYDLDQQVELFRSMRTRYKSWGGRVLGEHTDLVGVLLIAGAAFGVIYLGYRRRWFSAKQRPKQAPSAEQAATLRSVALYRQLEEVLVELGIARPTATPPLAHARALVSAGHPTGPEVLALTERYLQARFGHRRLDPVEERDYAARVKALRQYRQLRERAA